MVLKILIIASIILQLSAALMAMRFTKETKFNSSWVLITIALTLMTFMRVAEYTQFSDRIQFNLSAEAVAWIGVATSLCFAAGVMLIRKVLDYIKFVESQRRLTDRRILNTILNTEEKERLRFSKEIHDGLGPLLSSVKMSVSALAGMEKDDKTGAIISNISFVADEAIRTLKEISNNLSPHVLANFGLVRAVNNFINKISLPGVTFGFTSNLGERRFNTDVEVILYRVLSELINNSLKHSQATRINIDISMQDGLVCVDFEDNGIGFDVDQVLQKTKGMGLGNILSRIESIKGGVVIDSVPEKGTFVKINVNTSDL